MNHYSRNKVFPLFDKGNWKALSQLSNPYNSKLSENSRSILPEELKSDSRTANKLLDNICKRNIVSSSAGFSGLFDNIKYLDLEYFKKSTESSEKGTTFFNKMLDMMAGHLKSHVEHQS